MDVKAAVLLPKIDEEVYIEKPNGFETLDSSCSKLVCKLKKINQWTEASRQKWVSRIFNFFNSRRSVNLLLICKNARQANQRQKIT